MLLLFLNLADKYHFKRACYEQQHPISSIRQASGFETWSWSQHVPSGADRAACWCRDGLFFGEMTTGLKFIGDIYIGLLQMMLLFYIIIYLIGGIGKLTLELAKQLSLLPVRS